MQKLQNLVYKNQYFKNVNLYYQNLKFYVNQYALNMQINEFDVSETLDSNFSYLNFKINVNFENNI